MSKKNRAHRRTAPGQVGTGQAAAGQGASARDRAEAEAIVERVMSSLWAGIAAADPLRAELETAACMAFPYVLGQRDPADVEAFISTVLVNGAVRRRLVQEEFAECTPPAGMTREEFVDAAYRVVEDLWRDDEENPTFQAASRLFAEGLSRHDVIHRLADAPAPTTGSSSTR